MTLTKAQIAVGHPDEATPFDVHFNPASLRITTTNTLSDGNPAPDGIYRTFILVNRGSGTPATAEAEGLIFRRSVNNKPLIGLIFPTADQTLLAGQILTIRWRDDTPSAAFIVRPSAAASRSASARAASSAAIARSMPSTAAAMSAGSMMPLAAGSRPMARSSASPFGPSMIRSPAALLLNL